MNGECRRHHKRNSVHMDTCFLYRYMRRGFLADFVDESAECRAIYNGLTPDTDLSEVLNRNSANFSTNLTELIVNYRYYFFIPYETVYMQYFLLCELRDVPGIPVLFKGRCGDAGRFHP